MPEIESVTDVSVARSSGIARSNQRTEWAAIQAHFNITRGEGSAKHLQARKGSDTEDEQRIQHEVQQHHAAGDHPKHRDLTLSVATQ